MIPCGPKKWLKTDTEKATASPASPTRARRRSSSPTHPLRTALAWAWAKCNAVYKLGPACRPAADFPKLLLVARAKAVEPLPTHEPPTHPYLMKKKHASIEHPLKKKVSIKTKTFFI